jgi:hypothetical protein
VESNPKADYQKPKARSGVVVPHRPTFWQRLGAWGIFLALRGLALTLRRRLDDRSGFLSLHAAEPAIYVIWHNRLALCLEAYHGYIHERTPKKGLAVMVSASRDGGFLTGILELYGVQPARGSSSRRGGQALLELTGWAQRGYDLAITPDGPRGPRYVVQDGVMSLAQLTGLPIVPVSYALNWRIQLKSWDGFLVPLPFARWTLVLAPPVRVPREATDTERENLRKQLETTMREITRD